MRRSVPCILLATVLVVLCAGMARAERTVTDQTGRKVALPAKISRVVSFAPSITEMVYAIGKGNLLAGATLFSDYPPQAEKLPRVGSYAKLDLEKIITLRPDLCLAIKDGTPLTVITTLTRLGIAVYCLDIRTVDGIFAAMLDLGNLLNAGEQAEKTVKKLKSRLEKISGQDFPKSRPKVFYQIGASPMATAGNGTVINTLIRLAGGNNIAADMPGYPRAGLETILSLAPDVIVIPTMGDTDGAKLKSAWLRWPMIPAVGKGRVYVVNSDIFDRPGPRIVDAVEELNRLIYPGKSNDR